MNPGRLRHKVTFQRSELVKLPSGARENQWVDIATNVRAEVKGISGRELLASGAEMSEITVRIWMRFRPDINSTCRMVFNGLNYDIQSAIPDVKRTRLELLCKQGVKSDG
ncbi:phage head closure protein [Providencia heimbachae]|uniref:Phage protein n=1 Tax=Providencia heimbachae ATCC 35613 TaxID=1354272 RepID=A0A1B7K1H3_9GAMM|nr:phage head closure protein [Providencia heimbachae]OAT53986.1 phage protein [Providencia heimbachae ATCC 35613]SQH13724.1 Bacteriophage head-tail adaptor [Providencia heimbachae]